MQQPPAPLATIWITGLPASGKSTLSEALERALRQRGYDCSVLDGEIVRQRTGYRYGHSLADRFTVLLEIVAAAIEERSRGRIPIVATISHKRTMRALARQNLAPMLEVFLSCQPSVCAARDRKGHYQRAYAGEYDCFVGVTEPYERWNTADLVIDTGRCGVAEASARLLAASLAFLGRQTRRRPGQ